jgi:hypothetical protein
MNWYIAKIVFQIICDEGNHTPQFDEQLRLIAAENEGEALKKARVKGINEQDQFLNTSAKNVRWQFIDVTELTEIKELKDGVEFSSRIEETDDAGNYLYMIRQKARYIENRMTNLISVTK